MAERPDYSPDAGKDAAFTFAEVARGFRSNRGEREDREDRDPLDRLGPPTVDDVMGWGKYPGGTYREAARRDPGYMQWAGRKLGGSRGDLCAEALALHLGVTE